MPEISRIMAAHLPKTRRFKVTLPIRVRGMSADNKFFDEAAETLYVSPTFIITRLQNRIELDSEVHVTSKSTRQGGTFRTVWIAAREGEGGYDTGMEMLDIEGNLWDRSLEKHGAPVESAPPDAHLKCQRCHAIHTAPVPEALEEFIRPGFTIARHCEKCKGTTKWGFSSAETTEPVRTRNSGGPDDRRKGRVAIKMKIKVYCDRLGSIGEDVCETINISANGLYFATHNPYKLGETLRIVAPFEEGSLAIPVPARVVRLDRPADSSQTRVAVELNRRERPEPATHPS